MKPFATSALSAVVLLLVPAAAIAADNPAQGITLAQQSADQWRASKLIGVSIYGPDNKSIGKITDVLMSHDGGAQDIIVGVGGFLGIGEKDVAIPFKAVNFSDKPMPVATAAPSNNLATPAPATGGAAMAPNGTAANGGMMTATPGLGSTGDTLGNPGTPAAGGMPAGAATVVPSTAAPYVGTIAFTADQLKSAPAFKYAP